MRLENLIDHLVLISVVLGSSVYLASLWWYSGFPISIDDLALNLIGSWIYAAVSLIVLIILVKTFLRAAKIVRRWR